MAKSGHLASAPAPKLVNVPIGKIDEPELAVRQTMDQEKLEDLARSLGDVGLLQPVLVEAVDGRYRIYAGHRRYLAARMAGLLEVPCIVYPPGHATAAAVLSHENAFREDPNPAEEAMWLQKILELHCDNDCEKLCELTKLKKPYVDERLLLIQGDLEVFEATRRGDIPLAVARELNRWSDAGQRRLRLHDVIASGAPARIVKEWRHQDERVTQATADAVERGLAPPAEVVAEGADPLTCLFCRQSSDKHEMRLRYVHVSCEKALERGLAGNPLGKG